ncbi:MAG: DUF6134 family protein [Limibacillus sp.]
MKSKFILLAITLMILFPPCKAFSEERLLRYDIIHGLFGDIGESSLVIHRDLGSVTVETSVTIEVTAFSLPLHVQKTKRREVWLDGRIVSFQDRTDENGSSTTLDLWQENGALHLLRNDGSRAILPLDSLPASPWSRDVLEAERVFAPESGRLIADHFRETGSHPASFKGKASWLRCAQLYDGKTHHFCFAKDGLLAAAIIDHPSGSIRILRKGYRLSKNAIGTEISEGKTDPDSQASAR